MSASGNFNHKKIFDSKLHCQLENLLQKIKIHDFWSEVMGRQIIDLLNQECEEPTHCNLDSCLVKRRVSPTFFIHPALSPSSSPIRGNQAILPKQQVCSCSPPSMVFMDEFIHSAPWRQGMKSSLVPVALLQTTMQRDGNTYRKTFLFCSIVTYSRFSKGFQLAC